MEEKNTANLPVIDISHIDKSDIELLSKCGFCYVKLSDKPWVQDAINKVRQASFEFYRQPEAQKQYHATQGKLSGDGGYKNHGLIPGSKHFIQQCYFRPDKPFGNFASAKDAIVRLSNYFEKDFTKRLIKALLQLHGLDDEEQKNYQHLTDDMLCSFSTAYYPDSHSDAHEQGLTAHRDFGLLTTLIVSEEPGLEVLRDNEWRSVDYKPGYIVVNLATALHLIFGKKCESALHRVRVPQHERLSFGYFFDPNLLRPINDLTTGEKLFETGKDFLDNLQCYLNTTEQQEEESADVIAARDNAILAQAAPNLHRTGSPMHQAPPAVATPDLEKQNFSESDVIEGPRQ